MNTGRPPNHYADIGLDRASERRGDEAWIRTLLTAPSARILPVWRSQNMVVPGEEPSAVMLGWRDAEDLIADGETVFLGVRGDAGYFAVDVSHHDEPAGVAALAGRGDFVELRSVGVLMSRDEGGLLAYAKGIMHWHSRHRFCGVCGAATEIREAGFLRLCTNPACAASHFPRTDPAVIMLVSRGDRALLGRKPEWVEGMYSTLAGFVEPGESLEEAVVREVMEEVGIRVSNVRYHSSQPWPFPASLMLGFHADAEADEIRMNRHELEDAGWFTRAELADGAAGIARRPRSDSIARRLIDDWIKAG